MQASRLRRFLTCAAGDADCNALTQHMNGTMQGKPPVSPQHHPACVSVGLQDCLGGCTPVPLHRPQTLCCPAVAAHDARHMAEHCGGTGFQGEHPWCNACLCSPAESMCGDSAVKQRASSALCTKLVARCSPTESRSCACQRCHGTQCHQGWCHCLVPSLHAPVQGIMACILGCTGVILARQSCPQLPVQSCVHHLGAQPCSSSCASCRLVSTVRRSPRSA